MWVRVGRDDGHRAHPEMEGGHHPCPMLGGQWEVGLAPLLPLLGERLCCGWVPGSARWHRGPLLILSLGKAGAQGSAPPEGAAEFPGLCHIAQLGTVWAPLAVQEKRDLRVMDTDYSHYAIVYEIQHSKEKPKISLQLFSECHEWGWAPGAPRGGGGAPVGGRGRAAHHSHGLPCRCPAWCHKHLGMPREFISGWVKPCTKNITSWLQFEAKTLCTVPVWLRTPGPASCPLPTQAGGSLIPKGLCPFAASQGQPWGVLCLPCISHGFAFVLPWGLIAAPWKLDPQHGACCQAPSHSPAPLWVSGCSEGAGHEPPAPAEVPGAHPHHGPDPGHAGHPAQVR